MLEKNWSTATLSKAIDLQWYWAIIAFDYRTDTCRCTTKQLYTRLWIGFISPRRLVHVFRGQIILVTSRQVQSKKWVKFIVFFVEKKGFKVVEQSNIQLMNKFCYLYPVMVINKSEWVWSTIKCCWINFIVPTNSVSLHTTRKIFIYLLTYILHVDGKVIHHASQ